MAGRLRTGRGGGGRRSGPPTPPPAPPPQLQGHRGDPSPPRSRGDAPPPPEGTATLGGGDAAGPAHRAPQHPQPPAPDPHQCAGAARGPSLGAAHGGAPEQYGGRAPHDPPMTIAHSGRAEGGFRSEGAPGGAVQGPLLIPPPPGRPRDPDRTRTPGGSAPMTRGGPG